MSQNQTAKQWNLRPSRLARCTTNPIRNIIENRQIRPNPDKSIIPLSVGDPTYFGNLKPPSEILDAIRESLTKNECRSYPPMTGNYEARKAIAEYSKLRGDISPDDVIISSGCAHAIDIVQSTLAQAGQNIIVPRPGYAIHQTLGEGLGIEIKRYNLLPEDGWKVDLKSLESQIDENTAAIVVNNPSNPCGSVYNKEHLSEILAIASRRRVPIIADEIYEHFVLNSQEFTPIASLTKDVPVVTCSGLSKKFLVPGWRVGWIIIHDRDNILGDEYRKAFTNMASRILGASTLLQHALPGILKCENHHYFADMISFIEAQAKLCYRELQKAPGFQPLMPQGSMYMMVKIDTTLFPAFENELQLITQMYAEQSVLCIPGQCFSYPGYMRLVLTVPEDIMLEACNRMVTFCKQHVISNIEDQTNGTTVKPQILLSVKPQDEEKIR